MRRRELGGRRGLAQAYPFLAWLGLDCAWPGVVRASPFFRAAESREAKGRLWRRNVGLVREYRLLPQSLLGRERYFLAPTAGTAALKSAKDKI